MGRHKPRHGPAETRSETRKGPVPVYVIEKIETPGETEASEARFPLAGIGFAISHRTPACPVLPK